MSSSPFSRRRLLIAGVTGAAATTGLLRLAVARATSGPSSYTASWSSVDQHPPAPEWFQDAKFGIYYHWGVFSVPAFASEWYPRNMYNSGSYENKHHIATFGDPSVWPYHNFINGANDKSGRFVQFAPKLTSAGGNFDPNEWAQLFADAGAKFAGPVAEHHDGFSMWNSTVNEWNSVAKGPKLDLLKLHADAIRAKGLKLFVAMHHAYNFTGYFSYAPAQSSTSLKKLYGQLGNTAEFQLWYDKLKEIIDGYQPDIIWQDFNLSKIDEAQRLKFLAYYYNQAVARNKDVVATYKDGFNTRGEVVDYERGGPAGIQNPYWLTDDSISSSSWCYTTGIGYYSLNAMLHSLIDRVSKNGNMVLNIAPMADGTIPSGQRTVLLGIGDYLKRFGESIYNTRAWTTYGEGPTQMGGGSFTTPRAGTSQDIRFTRSKDNQVLYATVLGWPGGTLNIAAMKSGQLNLSTLSSVQLLGSTAGSYINLPNRSQDSSGLHISMPSSTAPFSAPAYVVKLSFGGQTPSSAPASSLSASVVPSVSASVSPSGGQPGTLGATYRLVNSWSGGFQGEVTVHNGGSSTINGWTVRMTLAAGQSIASIWNGVNTGTSGAITVKNATYNGALAAGGSVTFGFTANGDGSLAPSGISCTTP